MSLAGTTRPVTPVALPFYPMARSADPERLYLAHRIALSARLVNVARISEHSAERWVAAWEAEAAFRGLDRRTGGWWEPAWDWIEEQRRR